MAFGLLHQFLMGETIDAYQYFGAHFMVLEKMSQSQVTLKNGQVRTKMVKEKVPGVMFRLYAPLAQDVSVIGDFNSWNPETHKMTKIDDAGVFECFIPDVKQYESYKYHFKNARGVYVDKADPYAFFSEHRPLTSSRVFDIENFVWHDDLWCQRRTRNFDQPMSIYEMHLGSWLGKFDGRFLSYEEIADHLIHYVKELGHTHVELLPIYQHPFDGSWGYQATGFFAVDSKYGNPHQLMSFVDRLHQAGIGVIFDFAPVHFASDSFGLINFDGHAMYEYADDRKYTEWGSLQFNYGDNPVRSFLMSVVNYYLSYFHMDGVRIDAVSNLLFYAGNKERGQNSDGIEFCKRLNSLIHGRHSEVMMIAEDSSDFSGVTRPLEYGGVGFDYKWDLGWMNDTLKYFSKDPIYRKYEHHLLTFSMAYFYSENFILPLSHDEVVHGKGTIINKLHGDYEMKFQTIRNLYTYMWAHPGKKLNFMGNELASFDEWNESKSLPWILRTFPKHDSILRLVRDLNLIYKYEAAMHVEEYNPNGFNWLMVDNHDQSIFAFERKYQDSHLIFVFNMTSNYYDYIRIGAITPGTLEEIFNSEKDVYGGSNLYNGDLIRVQQEAGPEGRPCSFTIRLASNGALILKYKK
ncbi:MAG: 1,4-alpha-glucan branching protein GlgB [Erysipelotrichaceae bacterium]|jgi:1,4-alpha-glucan branching enzyme|nr:1,4-alpha-glucan branching protein GlgB [Erysipelotrichaceae bacterium]